MRISLGSRADKERIRSTMITPFTGTFYGEVMLRGQRVKFEFDVIDDRGRLGEVELGRWIKRTVDVINNRRILPYGGRPGRYGVYNGFEKLWSSRWFRHGGILKYDFDRNYERVQGGVQVGAG